MDDVIGAGLLAERDRLELVLANISEGVTITSPDGRFLFANAAAARLIGVESPEVLVALPPDQAAARFRIYDADGAPMPLSSLPGRRVFAGEDPGEVLVRFRPVGGGEERASLVRAVGVRGESGAVEYVIYFFREVTAELRHAAREAFVAEAGAALASLDWEAGLRAVAVLAVPRLADVCTIDLVDAGGRERRVARVPPEAAAPEAGGARISAAIETRGHVAGTIALELVDPYRRFEAGDLEVLEDLARRAAVVVERQRAEEERARLLVAEQHARAAAESAADTLAKLADVSEVALAHLSLHDLLDALLDRVVHVVDADTAAILLLDQESKLLTVRAAVGLDEQIGLAVPIPLGKGLAGRVAAMPAPLVVDDLDAVELVSPVLRERGLKSVVAIPLVVEERAIGVVHAGSELYGHFTPDHAKLLELIADRIALAVNQSALREAEREAQERLAFMAEASTVLASSLAYEETLAALARLAVPRLADWCAIDMLVDGTVRRLVIEHVDPEQVAVARRIVEKRPLRPGEPAGGGLGRVLQTGRPLLVEAVAQEQIAEAFSDDLEVREWFLRLGLRSYMIVPLVARGRTLGAISFVWAESGRRYGASDLAFVQELAARAAIAVDNARLYSAAEEGRDRLGFLAEASAILGTALDPDTALTRLANLVAGRVADWCSIHLTDEQGLPRLVTIAHADDEKAAGALAYAQTLSPSLDSEHGVSKVIRTGEAELFTKVPPELLEGPVAEAGVHSTLIVPLNARGRTLGALTLVQAESPRPFTGSDVEFAEDLARRAGVAVDNAQLYREAAERAQAARVLASVGDGVVLVDRSGTIRYWNRAAATITGLAEDDAVDRPVEEAIPGWLTVAERVPVAVEGATNPRPESLPLALGDREVWLSVAGVEVGDGVVYAFRDLTEDRALDELKTEFISTVSHELRTPLAAIYGAAMTLRRTDVTLDDEQRDSLLAVVSNEADRLARIVNDILWASRIETDTLRVAIESCDPLELAREVVTAQRAHLPPGIEIAFAPASSLPLVAGDPDKVRQVLVNLVDNAIKYSPDGGRVTVAVRPSGGHVRFSVADEGLGVPPAEQRRIFEKFYRLDPNMTRGIGGTGLGLYISRELVRRMSGRIWVESEPGRGSTFTVELPVAGREAEVVTHRLLRRTIESLP